MACTGPLTFGGPVATVLCSLPVREVHLHQGKGREQGHALDPLGHLAQHLARHNALAPA